MARLSEVLGGILKDVTQSRMIADLRSQEIFEAYRSDALLSRLPVPRVTIRELNLTLRFAIAGHVRPDYAASDLEPAREAWKSRLITVVLARALADVADGPREIISGKLARAVAAADEQSLPLAMALEGDADTLRDRSVELIVRGVEALTAAERRTLPAARALRELLKQVAQEELAHLLPELRRAIAAKGAQESDLDILVGRAELADVDGDRVQQIAVTLVSDDIEVVSPGKLEAGRPIA